MAITTPAGSSRRDFIRLTGTLGMAAGLAVSLAACGGKGKASGGAKASGMAADQEVTHKDGVITAGISYELGTNGYDPMTTSSALTVAANWHTLEGLTELHPATREVYAALAAEMPKKVDDTTYEVALRKDAKFSDGSAVTADDVVFSFTRVLDPANKSLYSQFLPFIDKVEAKDASTVTIKLKYAFSLVAERLSVVKIVPKAVVEADAKKFDMNPTGSGPYKMTEYKEGEYVKLEAFKDYLGKAPAIKEVIVKVVPSETELDQLLQGEVDMLTSQGQAEKIDPVKDKPGFSYTNYYRHGGGTIALHCNFGPTSLTEVRQAFAYVLNRPKIVELFLGQYGISSNGPYSKNDWTLWDDDEESLIGTAAVGKFESTLTSYDILDKDGKFDEAANIAKAHELLDMAAKRTDGDYAKLTGNAKSGYLWEGKPLEIKITYTPFWSDTYNLVFNDTYVSKLGFKISLTGLDWPVMYSHWTGDTKEERTYHAFVGGTTYTLKANPKSDYATKLIKPWGQPSINNVMFSGGSSYTPAEWDQLLDDIENAHPVTGRNEYRKNWRKFITTINKELPVIPVYSNNYYDLFTDKLQNFHTTALWNWARALPEANWKK